LLSDPVERTRSRHRNRFAIVAAIVGVASQPLGLSMRVEMLGGGKRVMPVGVVILLIGTVLIGLAIALWAMRPVRISAAQRLAARFLRGRLCRGLFASAEVRYKRELEREGRAPTVSAS
jgi:hypothetical protein